jgi:hypothetical protein
VGRPDSGVRDLAADAARDTTGIVVKDNLPGGENRRVLVEGEGRKGVTVQGNE